MPDPLPEQTDNTERPEDGPQEINQKPASVVTGDADDAYDPDRDGISE